MRSKYSVGRLGTRPSDKIMAHTTLVEGERHFAGDEK
jgi:hypothetical protein